MYIFVNIYVYILQLHIGNWPHTGLRLLIGVTFIVIIINIKCYYYYYYKIALLDE